MFKTVLRPNTSYQFRYRERKKPIRNNYGTKLQQMFNYPCLPTYLATDWRCSWCCIHASFQDWFWISMCGAICANTQWSCHSPAAILQGKSCCTECFCAVCVCLQQHASQEMWIMLVRIGERWCAPTSLLQLGRFPLISYLQKGLHFTNFSYL